MTAWYVAFVNHGREAVGNICYGQGNFKFGTVIMDYGFSGKGMD